MNKDIYELCIYLFPGKVCAVAILGAGIRPLRVQTAQRVIITKRSLHANPTTGFATDLSDMAIDKLLENAEGTAIKSAPRRKLKEQWLGKSGQGIVAKTEKEGLRREQERSHGHL